ncbi:Cyclic AMP receptor-like protein A isoform X1 [Oopsacas minuta]|uniref:Cyclic AMP receptor-like protein A isoform X1 n=1 Tax=Oopsacas minuta TaxID=111878 RepID=A0AAV7K882_9METZ|nr:Cyclic AMP receptor-like protein A isoform X1 [Oopsacas minuta]
MSETYLWRDYKKYSTNAIQSHDLLSCGAIFEPYDEAMGQIYCYSMFAVRELSAILSFLSCLFVVFVIWLFKRFFSTSNEGCAAFIFFLTFSIWSVIIWNLNITFKLFQNIVLCKTSSKWVERIFIANALIFPIIFSFVTILPQFLQDITFQCQWNSWNASRDFNIHEARIFYGSIWVAPSSLAFIFVIACYLAILLAMLRRKIRKQDREVSKALLLYPLIILASYLFPLLVAIINLIGISIEIRYLYFLIIIAVFTRPLLGLLISIVYFTKKENYKHLNLKEIELEFLSHLKRTKVKEYPITQMDHNFKQTNLELEHSFHFPNDSQVTNRNARTNDFHMESIPSHDNSLENLTSY